MMQTLMQQMIQALIKLISASPLHLKQAIKCQNHMNKVKRQSITALLSYSSIKLTQDMEDLLNSGQKFAMLPLK